MKSSTGFTLVEIMVVVVIVGILMAIAWPSYQGSVLRSHRADAHSSLLNIASREERFVAQSNTYTTVIGTAAGLNLGRTQSSEGYFDMTVAACATGTIATCYLITATAKGGQLKDAPCLTITYDSAGTKGGTTGDCW